MLVIRRRAGEGFLIGDFIEVDILEIDGNQVKIGIRAPRETSILRREIAATRDTNLESAQDVSATAVEKASQRLRLTPPSKHTPLPKLTPPPKQD